MSRDIFYRILATIVIIILIFALHRFITVHPRPQRPVLAKAPLLIAHRGGAGLWPENTLLAFRHAADMGVDMLEMDVHLTADGDLVVIHDASVDRTTNGSGPVAAMTVAQLKKLDAGYNFSPDQGDSYPYRGQGVSIPTLDEVLTAFPDYAMSIEIKDDDPRAVQRLAELIDAHQAQQRVIIASFHDDALKRFRKLQPEIATSGGRDEIRTFYIFNMLHLWRFHRPHADVYQVPVSRGKARFDSASFIEHAHRMNQKVQYWTIDDPAEMRRLLALGADGIITNRPDLALDLFKE